MTDWGPKVQAAIKRLQTHTKHFSDERMLGLIDWFAANGSISRPEMQAHGSPYFTRIVFSHVTTAVHGGGKVPSRAGWYRTRPGQPHVIDPAFAAAWISARQRNQAPEAEKRRIPDTRDRDLSDVYCRAISSAGVSQSLRQEPLMLQGKLSAKDLLNALNQFLENLEPDNSFRLRVALEIAAIELVKTQPSDGGGDSRQSDKPSEQ